MTAPAPDPAAASEAAPRRRRRRRALALAFGLGLSLVALLALEVVVRLSWSGLVLPTETPLLEDQPLGPALRAECLDSPSRWLRDGRQDALYVADAARGVRLRPNVHVSHDVVAEGDATVAPRLPRTR